jgi:hypothetical protein
MKASASTWILAAALGTAFSAGLAGAQPAGKPEAPPPQPQQTQGDGRQDFPADAASAKKFLERRIEETNKREEHFKALLARLENGESAAAVGKDFDGNRAAVRDAARRPDDHGPGDPRPDQRRNGGQGNRARLTPEEKEHALAFLRENSPELAGRFDRLLKNDPESGERVLGHMAGRIKEAEALKAGNPALFSLRMREMEGGAAVVDALKTYRDAKNATPQDPAKLDAATEQLRTALSRQLDVRLSVQENEIESLTKRLADLKSDLEAKRSGRSAAIESMMEKVRDGKDLRERGPDRDGDRKPAEGAAPAAPKSAAPGGSTSQR